MSNWSNLPLEILTIIFSYLRNPKADVKQTDLAQCALTCTQWKNTAHSLYFSEIKLESTVQFDNIESLVSEYPLFGKWVKKLTIRFEFGSNNDLIKTDALFPCVEVLGHHVISTDLYWFLFHKLLVKDGKFRYLKRFELTTMNKYQCGLYIECLMFIKDRVTFMDLYACYTYYNKRFYRNIYEHFVDNLHQFNNLSAIRIYDDYNDVSCRMIDFLETFTQSNSISDINYTLEADSSEFYSSTDLNIATLRPATNMKKLFLYIGLEYDETLSIASDNSLRYLMKKFPNLDSLHIDYTRTDLCLMLPCLHPEIFDHTIQSAAVMTEFLIYLSKIPNCSVRLMINSNDNTAQVIQGLYTSTAANKRSNISWLRNLKIVHCQASQVEPEDLQRKVFMDFETINAKTQKIHISFNDNDITRFLQQRLDLIEQTGHFFDHLHIELDTPPNELIPLVNHTTKYCTRLNELTISSCEDREKHDWESFMFRKFLTKNRNVKKLNLLGRLPFLEQTQYIMHQLEGLEALYIHLSHTSRNANRTIEDEPSSLMNFLPNGSFKSLEIVLDATSIYQRNMESCFIRLITELEESDRYFSLRVIDSVSYEVIENLTESDFESSISDPTSLHWQIYCKSVESFTIKYIASNTGKLQRITISP